MKPTLLLTMRRALTSPMTAALIAALSTTLTACGGTNGADTTLAQSDAGSAQFLSTTSFRGGRLLLLFSLEGGLTYGFYQVDAGQPTLPYVYHGVFIVRRVPEAKDTDPTVGIDYDFEQGTSRPATLVLTEPNAFGIALGALTTITAGLQMNATETEPFFATESGNASLDTDTTTLSGTYAIQGRSVNASLRFPAKIENGHLTATAADGCAVDATLRARSKGNVYDVKATLGSGCPIASGSFTGHALQAYATGNVFVFLESPTLGGVMLLLGNRQSP